MKILLSALSCNSQHGSEALVGYKYAEALASRHDVTLIASPPVEVPRGAKCLTVSAGVCDFNDVVPSSLMRFELGQLPRAWRLNRREQFDCVHRATPSAIQNGTFLAALGRPLIVGPLLASDPIPPGFDEYLTRAATGSQRSRLNPRRLAAGLASRLNRWSTRHENHLRRVRKILVGTKIALERIPTAWHDRCEPIPYAGVEHDLFVPPNERAKARPVELLYVGRLVPYKGVELLLRAAAMATKRIECRLRVVGGGNPAYREFCRTLVEQLGCAASVQFIDRVPRSDLPRLYQETDIFCFPTIADTYGIALLEAMSAECAVVVSDIAGPREIVAEGTGVKVPMHDPRQYIHDYADALVALAGDPARRKRLGKSARQRVLEHHDWAGISARLLQIYETI